MARFRACRIEGCERNAHSDAKGARGWCQAHYQRWQRHGAPLGGGTPVGQPVQFMREALAYTGDECLAWPYSKDSKGYGRMQLDGKMRVVSRVICEQIHGAPPTPEHDAAHSCGLGHEGCIAPRHLSWKTRAENASDKLIHGTHSRGERCATAKLTEHQAREILALKGAVPQREIAEKYGITRRNVGNIHAGNRWGWLQKEAI